MKNTYLYAFILLCALSGVLLASCVKETEVSMQGREIVIGIGAANDTRATAITESNQVAQLTGKVLGMRVVHYNGTAAVPLFGTVPSASGMTAVTTKVIHSNNRLSVSLTPAQLWPVKKAASETMDFYAWHPYDASNASPKTSFSGTAINELYYDATAQQDLMVARTTVAGTAQSNPLREWNKDVPLHFNHTLAQVSFSARKSDASMANPVVRSITLTDVVLKGNVTGFPSTWPAQAVDNDSQIPAFTWTAASGGSGSLTWTAPESGVAVTSATNLTTLNNFLMIPMGFGATSTSKIRVEIDGVAAPVEKLFKDITGHASAWKSGFQYNYQLIVHPSVEEVDFEATVLAWNELPVNVNIEDYYFRVIHENTEYFWWENKEVELRVETNAPGTWRLDPMETWIEFKEVVSGNATLVPTEYEVEPFFGGLVDILNRGYITGTGNAIVKMTLIGASGEPTVHPVTPIDWTLVDGEYRSWGKVKATLSQSVYGGGTREISTTPVVCTRKPLAPYYAHSNIVMVVDGQGNKALTFAETQQDNNNKEILIKGNPCTINGGIPGNVQGVFFSWGGLVGFSTDGPASESEAVPYDPSSQVFWPEEFSYTPGITWDVPYIQFGANTVEDTFVREYGEKGYDETIGKGDICRYISSKGWVKGSWRMLRNHEVVVLSDEQKDNVRYGYSNGAHFVNSKAKTDGDNKYGFYPIPNGWMMGAGANRTDDDITAPRYASVFFPASGCWGGGTYTEFEFFNPGIEGQYWKTMQKVMFRIEYAGIAATTGSASERRPQSIRCISTEMEPFKLEYWMPEGV